MDGLSRNILSIGVVSAFYPVSFQSRPATSSTEAIRGYYKIKLGKQLNITFLPNEERLYSFHCPRNLLYYQADSRLHWSHVLKARRTSRFQLANANDENNHEYAYYLCLTNLHDRTTHVVSIPESPRWEYRNLILGEATAGAYVLHHPYSVLVYRFSFFIGLSVDNKNFLQDGSLRHAANYMRDFIYYVYSLHYSLPGQRIRININQFSIHIFQNYHPLSHVTMTFLYCQLIFSIQMLQYVTLLSSSNLRRINFSRFYYRFFPHPSLVVYGFTIFILQPQLLDVLCS